MWIHDNGQILRKAKSIVDDEGIRHPVQIFNLWKPSELYYKLGYKSIRIIKNYDSRFYTPPISGAKYTDENIDAFTIKRVYNYEPKYTLLDAKLKFRDYIQRQLKESYLKAKEEIEYLNEYEPTSDDITALEQYQTDLKNAYTTMKSDAQNINNYEDMISFIDTWRETYLPEYPINEEDDVNF